MKEHVLEVGLYTIGKLKILGTLISFQEPLTRYGIEKKTGVKPLDIRVTLLPP
ncbi:MAG: hypothetical protein QXX95_07940 [Nitrososphaerales archaeon]